MKTQKDASNVQDEAPAGEDQASWVRDVLARMAFLANDRAALQGCIDRLRARVAFVERLLAVCEVAARSSEGGDLRTSTLTALPARGHADGRTRVGLSQRELEIVRFVVNGISPAEIGARLNISVHTVRNHLKSCFRKLGVHTQIELINKVLAQGIAEL